MSGSPPGHFATPHKQQRGSTSLEIETQRNSLPLTTKRLAIRGVIFNWLTYLSQIAIVFYATPIYVEILGTNLYGAWSVIMAFTAWYLLADFGLRGAATKYIAQFEAEEDHESVNQVIVTTIGIYLVFTSILMVVVSAIAWFSAESFSSSHITPTTIRWIMLLSAGAVAVNLLGQIFEAALMAVKRFELVSLGALLSQILQAALMITALKMEHGLFAMAVIVLFIACITQVYRFVVAKRVLPELSLNPRHFNKQSMWKLTHFGGLSSIQIAARDGAVPASNILIGFALGTVPVAFFSIGAQLAEYGARLATGVAGPLMPVASQLDTLGRDKILRRAFVLGSKTLLAMGLVMGVVFYAIGFILVETWLPDVGDENLTSTQIAEATYPVVLILVPAFVLRMVGMASRSILMGTNRMGFLGKTGILEIALTMLVGISLLYATGAANGMALGIFAAQVVVSGLLLPVAGARTVGLSLAEYCKLILWPALSSAIPVALAGYAVWYCNNYTEALRAPNKYFVIMQAGCIGVVGAASMFMLCFDQHLRNDILSAFIGKKFLNSPAGKTLMKLPIGKQFLTPLLTHTGRGKPEPAATQEADSESAANSPNSEASQGGGAQAEAVAKGLATKDSS